MKITRKKTASSLSPTLKKRGRPPRPAKRYIDQKQQVSYISGINDTLNNPQSWTYMDYNRNQNYIQVIRKHYEEMIKMYGVDLTYFRKFNTFFMQGEENKANMIYGQDTTAVYYCSGMVRAFLDISSYNWMFNAMGYQNQEQITLYIGIEDFRARFATILGKVKKQTFYVPVKGNMQFNELTGVIDTPEFYAPIYGRFDDHLYAVNIYPEIKQRPINSMFYKSNTHKTALYPLTGTLKGQLYPDQQYPLVCSGVISGDLSYHSFENIQNSPAWQLAPQVGDYFDLHIGQITEQYQINQVIDRNMQNNSGINPLLGTYIFQVSAVRRTPSHEQFTDTVSPQNQKSEDDILMELHHNAELTSVQQQEPELLDGYKQNKQCKDTKQNKITNTVADNVYDYKHDMDDYVYGGYYSKSRTRKPRKLPKVDGDKR